MSRIGVNFSDDELQEMVQVKNNYHLHLTSKVKKKQLSLVLKLRPTSQTNNMNYKCWLQIIILITRRPILTATSMWALRSSATSSMKDKFQVIVFSECLTELNNLWFQFHQYLDWHRWRRSLKRSKHCIDDSHLPESFVSIVISCHGTNPRWHTSPWHLINHTVGAGKGTIILHQRKDWVGVLIRRPSSRGASREKGTSLVV